MIPRTNLRSNKRKRNHKNIQSDINGVSDDDSFFSESPLLGNILSEKNEATLISMDYPFITFRLQGVHDCRIEKATHAPSRQAVIGSITKHFARLIKSRGGCITMDDACQTLDIKKRRLYDVLQVLEGAGIIERPMVTRQLAGTRRKKYIRWILPTPNWREERREIQNLKEEEAILDSWIEKLSNSSIKDHSLLYTTPPDLLAHNHHKGHVDLIVSSPRGSQLDFVSKTGLRITQSSRGESNVSKVFVMEDNGMLQPIDHRIQPTPLLARCCSDFSINALSTS